MTSIQLFKWFCKEQGIMGEMFSLYHAMQPKLTTYENGGYNTRALSFDEYISNTINYSGFLDLFWNIESNYRAKVRSCIWERKPINENLITDKFLRVKKNWDYFVKNNLFVDENSLKRGDTVRWNNHIVTIKEIDKRWCNITAELATEGRGNRNVWFKFSGLRDRETNEPLKLNYYIKRKRRVYYGVNS